MTLSLERVSVNYWPDTQIAVPASNLKKDSACAAVQIATARRLPTGRVEEVLPSRSRHSFDSDHMDRHPQPYAS
jgi:hypothetical protein